MSGEKKQRSTFDSPSLRVRLDYAKKEEFLDQLGLYIGRELKRAMDEFPEGRKDILYPFWKDTTYHVWAFAHIPPGQVASVSFVEVNVNDSLEDLRFEMYEQKDLIPDPKGLVEIVKSYEVTEH